jgi:hypothetical protein
MDPIEFRNIGVIPFTVENRAGWRFQVIVGAGVLPIMGLSPRARLGAQTLEGIQVSPDGNGFGGYLRDPPTDGDRLFFHYPGGEEIDTDLTFREQQV